MEGEVKDNTKRALVLLSGGIDSTTTMAIARSEGYDIYCLTFRYGQRHAAELQAAERIAKAMGARRHLVLSIDLAMIGGSALTDNIEVPKGRSEGEMQQGLSLIHI